MKVFLAAILCALAASGQKVPGDPGVKKGSAIPAFSLTDQDGRTQTIESLCGPKGLMLVFVRSADW